MTQPTSELSEEYLRGWRAGYGAGRDDEAVGAPMRPGPEEPPPRRQTTRAPRDRQQPPGRNR